MEKRSDIIANTITRAIVNKRLLPGTKLGEGSLGEIFGVSRAVISQSIARLSEEGLVVVERNRGAFIAALSMQDAKEIYDSMTIIEQGVARQIIGRVTQSDWDKLRRHTRAQHHALHQDDQESTSTLGAGFHEEFVALSLNKTLMAIHQQLLRKTALFRSFVEVETDYCGWIQDHEKLIDLLELGHIRTAVELIEEHHDKVLRSFAARPEDLPEYDLAEAIKPYLT